MNKNTRAFALGLVLAVFAGVIFLQLRQTNIAHASRYVLDDGDIYLASDVIGSKRVTSQKDVKFLFGEKNGRLLIGKNLRGGIANSEVRDGADLYLLDADGIGSEKISDDQVDGAFFDKGARDRVVYVTRNADIKIYDLTLKKVAFTIHKGLNPDISSDGSGVVYKKLPENWKPNDYLDGSPGLYVTDLNSGSEHQLTNGEMDYAPLWSPDGKYILFFSNSPEGLNSLFEVNADGSGRTQITNIGEKVVSDKTVDSPSEQPIWSADGRYIVYESDRRIWVNELNLQSKKLISARPIAYGVAPSWVEDGKKISIVSTKASGKSNAVIIVDLDGNIINK